MLVAEFADFILEIAAHNPSADTIHLVMDNLSTHTRKVLVERFGEVAGGRRWNRFTVHHTPKHGSWLNQAEIAIGITLVQDSIFAEVIAGAGKAASI